MAYTMLSRAQNRAGIKLDSFNASMIKTNENALKEMNRMRKENVLDISHPITQMQCPIALLLNIRSWSLHINHIMRDHIYLDNCSILCFTETKVSNTYKIKRINQFDSDWEDMHFTTDHGLAICYKKKDITFITNITISLGIEAVVCKFQYQTTDFILILLYRKPGVISNFIHQLTEQIRAIRQSYSCRIIILGDFNLDQNLPENINLFSSFKQEFSMHQKTTFTTHNDGGILDLIFDTNLNVNEVHWLPTPFSDHFILFYTI